LTFTFVTQMSPQ